MTESRTVEEVEKGIFEGLFEALADKHSQLDINLQGVNIKLPNTQMSVELNGLLTITVHLRRSDGGREEGLSREEHCADVKNLG